MVPSRINAGFWARTLRARASAHNGWAGADYAEIGHADEWLSHNPGRFDRI